jgi:4-hydroxy-3-polyprenylbenzoate decarboxylase
LHFHTCTTIDTLDYSGGALNEGSKVVLAAAGPAVRELPTEIPPGLVLPPEFHSPRMCLPGVLAVQGPRYTAAEGELSAEKFCEAIGAKEAATRFPLIVLVDDSEFAAASLNNFLWLTFTRSNPAADIHGVGAFIAHKHWGCRGPVVIDARTKPHHAPPLAPDPATAKKVDALATRGGPLAKYL